MLHIRSHCLQTNDLHTRKGSPHSQQPMTEQNVECMVVYEPHDLNASLSSGSEKGSHAGSGSGSGSLSQVLRGNNRSINEDVSSQRDNYSRYQGKKPALPGTPPSTSTAKPGGLTQIAAESKPSIYAHGDYGVSQGSSNFGFNIPVQPNVQSGPAYTNIRPSYRNNSTGNYLPMDQYLHKDSGVSSSVSGSFRQEETSLCGLEDSGIDDIGTANYPQQQAGYAGSRTSAYSQDDYLLPVSHRIGNYGTEEQLKLQQLQLQRQEQKLQELQKQHYQIQQQLQMQHRQYSAEQQHGSVQSNMYQDQSSCSDQMTSSLKFSSSIYQDGSSVKSAVSSSKGSSDANETIENFELTSLYNYASTSSNIPQTSQNIAQSLSQGKYGGRKPAVKPKTSDAKPMLNNTSHLTAKQERQILSCGVHTANNEGSNAYKNTRYEAKPKSSLYGRKHTFAPQEGYTEVGTSRSSVRSSRSSSSKGSSSQGRVKAGNDPGRPLAANIILNIPGYRVPGRNKRLSSAEESDMESMTSVSVTSREVANIMTQAMRMQRNSSRRRSKCEHHHRTFTTKPGRSGNLSRSSNLRGSNSSNRSKGNKRACTRCGSQSQKTSEKTEKSGESLISFIEQSMRSFLLNSSETVSTEDTSSETKSSSERNKSPSDDSPGNTLEPANEPSPAPKPAKPTTNHISSAPTLFEIASYCDLLTIEIQNDYSNALGYGMHLQQVNFNPERYVQNARKRSNNLSTSLAEGSSAFDRFKGRTRLIYCVHMLDKAGVAAKNGSLMEGDYLIEVGGMFLCIFVFFVLFTSD